MPFTQHTPFPPGKYWVGDLCYAITDWNAFCDMTLSGTDVSEGEFPWKGEKIWHHTTAFGDGTYYDQKGRQYGVDAGLIGIIPEALIDRDTGSLDGGHFIDFPVAFKCSYEDGKFYFGDCVEINTGDDYYDADDEEDNEDDNES